MKLLPLYCLFLAGSIVFLSCQPPETESLSREAVTKPFTRWWWMGNAVTNEGLTQHLEAFQEAGFGGVEIVPIYGVKGYEDQFISYLDSTWMNRLAHTLREAERLNLEVDMALGTGWPCGGPHIDEQYAARKMEIHQLSAGTRTAPSVNLLALAGEKAKNVKLEAVISVQAEQVTSLQDKVNEEGILNWKPEDNSAEVYVLLSMLTGQQVKRSAPGGEGLVIDYFSRAAVDHYLQEFEAAFAANNLKPDQIRCFFHDSYEVYGANWTPGLAEAFQEKRGYDLSEYFYLLKDTSNRELSARIISDYQQTIAELLTENFATPLAAWCRERGVMFRNQSHGSPANLLDIYANTDIPETEAFGPSNFGIPSLRRDTAYHRTDHPEPLVMKFASSPAHLLGKQQVSSETATWLGNHFNVALSQVKPQVDELFVAGINHIFYHGSTYSPFEESFPGWRFYASTEFGHQSYLWNHLPALNTYIQNCQDWLQSSSPDQDVLIYFPLYDEWADPAVKDYVKLFTVHDAHNWLVNKPIGQLAKRLMEAGYSLDFISDQQISRLKKVDQNRVAIDSGNRYRAILIPDCQTIPLATLNSIQQLAAQGVPVFFQNNIPEDVPGFADYQSRQQSLAVTAAQLKTQDHVKISNDALSFLADNDLIPESLSEQGLSFIRKKIGQDMIYFIANLNNVFYQGEVRLNARGQSVQYYNPLDGRKKWLPFRTAAEKTSVFLRLEPGQSCFLKVGGQPGEPTESMGVPETQQASVIDGPWTIEFLRGGPELPKNTTMNSLLSWSELSLEGAADFSGTAIYQTTFSLPEKDPQTEAYLLQLGDVRESARIKINGEWIGTAWSLPFEVSLPATLLQAENSLEIEVSSLGANHLAYLDRKGVEWKKFYNINIVNPSYRPLDARPWSPRPSGLLGPVQLLPLREP